MEQKKLKEIYSELSSQGKMEFIKPATEEDITIFEIENDFKLPNMYKEWLLISDGGELFLPAGIQLYGVANKPLIDVSDNNRPSDNYIVIGSLPNGDPILCEKNNETISIFNSEEGKIESDEVYDNFLSFLYDLPNILGLDEEE